MRFGTFRSREGLKNTRAKVRHNFYLSLPAVILRRQKQQKVNIITADPAYTSSRRSCATRSTSSLVLSLEKEKRMGTRFSRGFRAAMTWDVVFAPELHALPPDTQTP